MNVQLVAAEKLNQCNPVSIVSLTFSCRMGVFQKTSLLKIHHVSEIRSKGNECSSLVLPPISVPV